MNEEELEKNELLYIHFDKCEKSLFQFFFRLSGLLLAA